MLDERSKERNNLDSLVRCGWKGDWDPLVPQAFTQWGKPCAHSSDSLKKQGKVEQLGPCEREVAYRDTERWVECPGKGVWMLRYLLLNAHSLGGRRWIPVHEALSAPGSGLTSEHHFLFFPHIRDTLSFLWEEIQCMISQLKKNFHRQPVPICGLSHGIPQAQGAQDGMVANGIVVRARLQMVLNTDLKSNRHTTAQFLK